MKTVKTGVNFEKFRCKAGRSKDGAHFCYQVKKDGKGHLVEILLPGGRRIGWFGKDCRMVYQKRNAFKFKGGPLAADMAAVACLRFTQKPGGKDPAVIYRRANQGKI